MNCATSRRRRRSIRLKHYDYTDSGAYCITLCTHKRHNIFGFLEEGTMHCNELGDIVHEEWLRTATLRQNVELDAFVVMPNHVHGILILKDQSSSPSASSVLRNDEAEIPCSQGKFSGVCRVQRGSAITTEKFGKPRPHSVSTIVRLFKSAACKRINIHRGSTGESVWQRGYYERIIRDDRELDRIRRYIENNPWKSMQRASQDASLPPRNSIAVRLR